MSDKPGNPPSPRAQARQRRNLINERLARATLQDGDCLPETTGEQAKGKSGGRARTADSRAVGRPRNAPTSRIERRNAKIIAVSLPDDGKKLVEFLVAPENEKKTPAEQAAAVGISMERLAEIKRHPAYQATLTKVAMRQLAEGVPRVVASWLRSSTLDGVQGHRDRRLLLEATGMIPTKNGPSVVLQQLILGSSAAEAGGIADRLAKALRMSDGELQRMVDQAEAEGPILDAEALDVVSEEEEPAV